MRRFELQNAHERKARKCIYRITWSSKAGRKKNNKPEKVGLVKNFCRHINVVFRNISNSTFMFFVLASHFRRLLQETLIWTIYKWKYLFSVLEILDAFKNKSLRIIMLRGIKVISSCLKHNSKLNVAKLIGLRNLITF